MSEVKKSISFEMHHHLEYDSVSMPTSIPVGYEGDIDLPEPKNSWDQDELIGDIEAYLEDAELDVSLTEISIESDPAYDEDEPDVEVLSFTINLTGAQDDAALVEEVLRDCVSDNFSDIEGVDIKLTEVRMKDDRELMYTRNSGNENWYVDGQKMRSKSAAGKTIDYHNNGHIKKVREADGQESVYKDNIISKTTYPDNATLTYDDKGKLYDGVWRSRNEEVFFDKGVKTHAIHSNGDRLDYSPDTIVVTRAWGNTEHYARNAVEGLFEDHLKMVAHKDGDVALFENGYPMSGTLHFKSGTQCTYENGKPVNGTEPLHKYNNLFVYKRDAEGFYKGYKTFKDGQQTHQFRRGETYLGTTYLDKMTLYKNNAPDVLITDMARWGIDKQLQAKLNVHGNPISGQTASTERRAVSKGQYSVNFEQVQLVTTKEDGKDILEQFLSHEGCQVGGTHVTPEGEMLKASTFEVAKPFDVLSHEEYYDTINQMKTQAGGRASDELLGGALDAKMHEKINRAMSHIEEFPALPTPSESIDEPGIRRERK